MVSHHTLLDPAHRLIRRYLSIGGKYIPAPQRLQSLQRLLSCGRDIAAIPEENGSAVQYEAAQPEGQAAPKHETQTDSYRESNRPNSN